ncbi:uncharacterized protein LOC106669720 isoform X2 [Cimex lectularius]|nr:uncharacterized protein LOC106669720 isoform X2 [Cimex lectularius]
MEALLGFLFLFVKLLAVNGERWNDLTGRSSMQYCSSSVVQTSLNLQAIQGLWYVVQTVYHKPNNSIPEGYSTRDVCPELRLYQNQDDQRHQTQVMRAELREGIFQQFYFFSIYDSSQPGVWVIGRQSTDNAQMDMSGTVEVLKAVGDHMVLKFCTTGVSLYSSVLSRSKTMSQASLKSINSMLTHWKLEKVSVVKTCINGASPIIPSVMFITFLVILQTN